MSPIENNGLADRYEKWLMAWRLIFRLEGGGGGLQCWEPGGVRTAPKEEVGIAPCCWK